MARTGWKRYEQGWLSPDGRAFAERGAPIVGGGTAWMIWVMLRPEHVGAEPISGGHVSRWSTSPKDGAHQPLRRIEQVATIGNTMLDETFPAGEREGWFSHRYDAGSLAEAKITAALATAEEWPDTEEAGA